MGSSTSISWADDVWNPMVGCTKVSDGCKHCYAERMANRLKCQGKRAYKKGFQPVFLPKRMNEPSRGKVPRIYLVCSMGDLFHEAFTDDQIDSVIQVVRETPRHVFQFLTKRPERMMDRLANVQVKNLWIGVSVENQAALPRLRRLLSSGGFQGHRFVLFEPLLEPLALAGEDLQSLSWAIIGGECGARARRFTWASYLSVAGVLSRAGVPAFLKSLGDNPENQFRRAPEGSFLPLGGGPDRNLAEKRARELRIIAGETK